MYRCYYFNSAVRPEDCDSFVDSYKYKEFDERNRKLRQKLLDEKKIVSVTQKIYESEKDIDKKMKGLIEKLPKKDPLRVEYEKIVKVLEDKSVNIYNQESGYLINSEDDLHIIRGGSKFFTSDIMLNPVPERPDTDSK